MGKHHCPICDREYNTREDARFCLMLCLEEDED